MLASTLPSWRESFGLASAYCSSRKILRDCLAVHPLHDEASAEVILGRQHMQHAW
jgi:hypothetical protein